MKCQGKRFKDPIRGIWPYAGYPKRVRLHGRVFVQAKMRRAYRKVKVQYREDRERNSWHLKVLDSGAYVIGHCDSYNPDYGLLNAAAHVMEDTEVGDVVKGAAVVGGVFLGIVGLVALLK